MEAPLEVKVKVTRERSKMLKVENEKVLIRGENWTDGKMTNEEGRDMGRREE
jgi:hypothetical protein